MTHPLAGKWRVVEMKLRGCGLISLLGTGHITFDDQDGSEFCFGAITGALDCSYAKASIHFTWGGCAELEEDSVTGEFRYHMAMAMNRLSPPFRGLPKQPVRTSGLAAFSSDTTCQHWRSRIGSCLRRPGQFNAVLPKLR